MFCVLCAASYCQSRSTVFQACGHELHPLPTHLNRCKVHVLSRFDGSSPGKLYMGTYAKMRQGKTTTTYFHCLPKIQGTLVCSFTRSTTLHTIPFIQVQVLLSGVEKHRSLIRRLPTFLDELKAQITECLNKVGEKQQVIDAALERHMPTDADVEKFKDKLSKVGVHNTSCLAHDDTLTINTCRPNS